MTLLCAFDVDRTDSIRQKSEGFLPGGNHKIKSSNERIWRLYMGLYHELMGVCSLCYVSAYLGMIKDGFHEMGRSPQNPGGCGFHIGQTNEYQSKST